MASADDDQGPGSTTTPLGRAEVGLALWTVITGLTAAWAYPLWRDRLSLLCPMWEIFGVPCPTCGGTRSMAALAAGEWFDALSWNPVVGVAGVAAIAFVPYAALVALGLVRTPALPVALPRAVKWVGAFLIGANWMYLCFTFNG